MLIFLYYMEWKLGKNLLKQMSGYGQNVTEKRKKRWNCFMKAKSWIFKVCCAFWNLAGYFSSSGEGSHKLNFQLSNALFSPVWHVTMSPPILLIISFILSFVILYLWLCTENLCCHQICSYASGFLNLFDRFCLFFLCSLDLDEFV